MGNLCSCTRKRRFKQTSFKLGEKSTEKDFSNNEKIIKSSKTRNESYTDKDVNFGYYQDINKDEIRRATEARLRWNGEDTNSKPLGYGNLDQKLRKNKMKHTYKFGEARKRNIVENMQWRGD